MRRVRQERITIVESEGKNLLVVDPDLPVSRLALLTATERSRLVEAWNDTTTSYPRDSSVPELFEDQVARCPETVKPSFSCAAVLNGTSRSMLAIEKG